MNSKLAKRTFYQSPGKGLALIGRFKKEALDDVHPAVPLDRVRAIAGACAPKGYTSVGKSNKRQPRQPVYKRAIAVLDDGEQVPVVIRNLSLTGCRIEFLKGLEPVGRLRLIEQSLALDVWGEVVWKGEGACGLIFEKNDQLSDMITSLESPVQPPRDVRPAARSAQEQKARISIRKR